MAMKLDPIWKNKIQSVQLNLLSWLSSAGWEAASSRGSTDRCSSTSKGLWFGIWSECHLDTSLWFSMSHCEDRQKSQKWPCTLWNLMGHPRKKYCLLSCLGRRQFPCFNGYLFTATAESLQTNTAAGETVEMWNWGHQKTMTRNARTQLLEMTKHERQYLIRNRYSKSCSSFFKHFQSQSNNGNI